MLNKNDEYAIEITGMGADGEGVGRIDGCAVFVPYAIQGETVKVKIVKPLKNYAFGKLLEVIKPSPDRREPTCGVFYLCGGCGLCHMEYSAELAYKQQKVADAVKRIGGIDAEIRPIIGSAEIIGYRNKGQFPVTADGIGFYAPRSHRVIPIDRCEIQDEKSNEIVRTVKKFMERYSVSPYNEAEHTGDIRCVYTRIARATGEAMVCIVTRTKKLPLADKLVEMLDGLGIGIVSVYQNINPERTNTALGEREVLLWGKGKITDKIGDLSFNISPKSFYQINSAQTKVLYDETLKAGGFTGGETVLDLYCGIGTITLYAASSVREITGVELLRAAVLDAKENAALNGITNAAFLCAAAEDIQDGIPADAVIIDPPRKGCDDRLLKALGKINSPKIIYVSCNPATLARDLKALTSHGYTAEYLQPVDMFPRTPHVETVVLLSKLKSE